MKKICILLLFIICCSLIGCSSGNSGNQENTEDTTINDKTETEENEHFNEAKKKIEQGDYKGAITELEYVKHKEKEIFDYSYNYIDELCNNNDFDSAQELSDELYFYKIISYDNRTLINEHISQKIDESNSNELVIDIRSPDSQINASENFFDLREWIEQDVSILGIDKNSLKRKSGWIEIGKSYIMNNPGTTRIKYDINTDKIETIWFMEDGFELDMNNPELASEVETIFGSIKEHDKDDTYSTFYSGNTRYQLQTDGNLMFIIELYEKHDETESEEDDYSTIYQNNDYSSETTVRHNCEVDGCYKSGTYSFEGISGLTEYYCEEHYNELIDMIESMQNSDDYSNNDSYPNESTDNHKCSVDGCDKTGTYPFAVSNDKTKYYCKEHYFGLLDFADAILND